MSSSSSPVELVKKKPHVVCVTISGQGHMNPMLKLAKLLHHRGFYVTFVCIEFSHQVVVRSRGGLPSFRFETICIDMIDPSADDYDIGAVFESIAKSCLAPFMELVSSAVSSDVPPVSSIISDSAVISFALDAAPELGVPLFIFCAVSAFATFTLSKLATLIDKGYLPLKDESYRTNGYLDTIIEDIPGMEGMRLRDLSSIIITTSKRFYPLKFMIENEERMLKVAKGFIVNTFDDLECDALNALWRSHLSRPSIYPIGPLHLLDKEAITSNIDLEEIEMNPWEEEPECLEWLDSNEPNSVLYVNFGTTTFVTHDQLTEFAWGLADSNQPFLWIIRPDLLVHGEKSTLPPEFLESMKKRGKLANWCPQEKVLGHSSIGGFLNHGGWNSILESMSSGVPMICWPFFSDQMTNCWRCCTAWGIGMELNGVNREVVERLVTELLTGDKGREMKKKAMEWKMLAHRSANNSSRQNLEKVISQLVSPLTGPE